LAFSKTKPQASSFLLHTLGLLLTLIQVYLQQNTHSLGFFFFSFKLPSDGQHYAQPQFCRAAAATLALQGSCDRLLPATRYNLVTNPFHVVLAASTPQMQELLPLF
jgi:hypothetical protein